MSKAHSSFSASSASRLMACPASYQLALDLDTGVRRSSVYAAEGTLAHTMAEACLASGADAGQFLGDTRAADGHTFTVDEEFVDFTTTYIEAVRSLRRLGYVIQLEQRVTPGGWVDAWGEPPLGVDLFGTADCIAHNAASGHLAVVDLKFGKGVPVEAKDNPQLLYYALGALFRYRDTRFNSVSTTIVQPRAYHRAGPVRTSDMYTPEQILIWGRDVLFPAVRRAVADQGRTRVAGKHCRWCPAQAQCDGPRNLMLGAFRAAMAAEPPVIHE